MRAAFPRDGITFPVEVGVQTEQLVLTLFIRVVTSFIIKKYQVHSEVRARFEMDTLSTLCSCCFIIRC